LCPSGTASCAWTACPSGCCSASESDLAPSGLAQLVAAGSAAQCQLPSDVSFLGQCSQAAHLQGDPGLSPSMMVIIQANTISDMCSHLCRFGPVHTFTDKLHRTHRPQTYAGGTARKVHKLWASSLSSSDYYKAWPTKHTRLQHLGCCQSICTAEQHVMGRSRGVPYLP